MNGREVKLIEHLPKVFHEIREIKVILGVISEELNLLNYNKQDVHNQFFIDTSTWGLTLWERRFAIRTDLSKTYEERRKIVRAKRRGYGTVTKEKVKLIAQTFTNADVDVIEESDKFRFYIEFINSKNKLNLNGLYSIIDEIKPAYLDYNVKLRGEKNINLQAKVETYDIGHNLCNTIDCGVESDIVTDGLICVDNIEIDTNNIAIDEFYPIV